MYIIIKLGNLISESNSSYLINMITIDRFSYIYICTIRLRKRIQSSFGLALLYLPSILYVILLTCLITSQRAFFGALWVAIAGCNPGRWDTYKKPSSTS